jgi:hypothetical protein
MCRKCGGSCTDDGEQEAGLARKSNVSAKPSPVPEEKDLKPVRVVPVVDIGSRV